MDKSHDGQPPLPAPIRRVFYLSSEGSGQEHEVLPPANPRALAELERCDALVYGCGSLYTSICPCVTLDGVGETIATRSVPKVRAARECGAAGKSQCGWVHHIASQFTPQAGTPWLFSCG